MAVIPVAKALYLCEEVDTEGDSLNLYALLDFLLPHAYPHTQPSFVCFAQLRGGLGTVRCHIDVRRADDYRLVRNTNALSVNFPNRGALARLVVHLDGCIFESPGLYLVELYCDNTWVADTVLHLREARE